MTGPREAVDVLIRLSNSAVNRQATEAEILKLMTVLGDGPMELKCRKLDRLLLGSLCSLCAIMTVSSRSAYVRRICISFGFLEAALLCHTLIRLRKPKGLNGRRGFRWLCRKWRGRMVPEITVDLYPAVQTEHMLEIGRIPKTVSLVSEASSLDALAPETHNIEATSNEKRYSLVIARESWYEIHTQLPFQSEFLQLRSEVLHTGLKVWAVKQDIYLPLVAAHHVWNDLDLVYLCIHNPMTDLNILEMKEFIVKAQRDILFVLILPVCELLSADMLNAPSPRLHTNRDARFVTSLADMSCWLTKLNTQVFSKAALVLPYQEEETLKASSLWRIMTDCMNSEILVGH